MRRITCALLLTGATAFAVAVPAQAFAADSVAVPTAVAADSGSGSVVVFSSEFQELAIYPKGSGGGCHNLPITSHVLDNLTDANVTVYADPFCTIPAALPSGGSIGQVAPGYGTHVSNVGSFKF